VAHITTDCDRNHKREHLPVSRLGLGRMDALQLPAKQALAGFDIALLNGSTAGKVYDFSGVGQ